MMAWWISVSKTRKKHALQTGCSVFGRRRIALAGDEGGQSAQGAIVGSRLGRKGVGVA